MISRYASLRQGLVGAWCPSLGASGFRLIDRSGYGNHGTLTNMDPGTDWVASGNGLALDFDGVDDYVNAKIPTIELSTDGCTLSLWYKNSTGTTGVYAALCSSTSGTQFLIFQASGSAINLGQRNNAGGDGSTSGGTWQSASWKNIIAVSTPLALTLYSNGSQTSTLSRTSGATTFNQISIGALNRAGSLSNYSISQQDDIRIYNRAITPSEIQLLYTGGRGVGLAPERIKHRRKTTAAAFRAAWARRQQHIGSGVY
jgi:hypothetical protein